MSLKDLQTRVTRLSNKVDPAPQIIDCTGVKEELLALLATSGDEREETPLVDDQAFRELDAMLQQSVERIEQQYHVRFV